MFKKLIAWSLKDYSHLPWRKKRSMYTTLVSEIMLQQTTVATVLKHYPEFIKKFPNIKSLSKLSEDEICVAWKGLGYYRRARNLRKAAIEINKKGRFPSTIDDLKKISGIGDYTASALFAIGKDQPALAIDANLERVLARIYGIKEKKGPKLHKKIKELVLPKLENEKMSFRELNEALMDLGRVYCQARKADCLICPMKNNCIASKKDPLSYPEEPVAKGTAKYYDLKLARFIVVDKNKILGYVKKESEWLSGQVEIPTFVIESEDKNLKQYPMLRKKKIPIESGKLKSSITKYRIENRYWVVTKKEFEVITGTSRGYKYFKLDRQNMNFSTTTIKILDKVLEHQIWEK